MLHGVGDVRAVAGDPGVAERGVEKPAGRPHERLALPVLHVARLLADQDDGGVRRAFTENRLAGPLIEIAALAAQRCVRQGGEVPRVRDERRGGRVPVPASHLDHHPTVGGSHRARR
jgi:hypothetical protein